ncbi:hypothetical protein AAVH_36470, partial [Aphelenchoides avenae]
CWNRCWPPCAKFQHCVCWKPNWWCPWCCPRCCPCSTSTALRRSARMETYRSSSWAKRTTCRPVSSPILVSVPRNRLSRSVDVA